MEESEEQREQFPLNCNIFETVVCEWIDNKKFFLQFHQPFSALWQTFCEVPKEHDNDYFALGLSHRRLRMKTFERVKKYLNICWRFCEIRNNF